MRWKRDDKKLFASHQEYFQRWQKNIIYNRQGSTCHFFLHRISFLITFVDNILQLVHITNYCIA
jgi:hypothetical protein